MDTPGRAAVGTFKWAGAAQLRGQSEGACDLAGRSVRSGKAHFRSRAKTAKSAKTPTNSEFCPFWPFWHAFSKAQNSGIVRQGHQLSLQIRKIFAKMICV